VKFGYAIVLALVALVAVTGFASADRLPQQVPENQIFTIDTLIDVTGAVSEESEMQWTLDSQDIYMHEADWVGDDVTAQYNVTDSSDAEAIYSNLVGLENSANTRVSFSGNYNEDEGWLRISFLEIPDWLSTKLIPGTTMTYGALIAAVQAEDDYYYRNYHDYGEIHDSVLNPTEEIMILTWTDSLRSNGGKLSLNKNIDFDSQNKGNGLSNLEVEKVLTYASTEGAHLVGSEEWTLDVAGNWEQTADTIRCVFASADSKYFPAFCNVVKAKSELVNINSAQISTKGSARAVASSSDIPAALSYQIAVTPDSNSGSGFADGTVKTLFAGSIMEARGKNNEPSATNNWKDAASVTGGIKNFQKAFNYESGFKIGSKNSGESL